MKKGGIRDIKNTIINTMVFGCLVSLLLSIILVAYNLPISIDDSIRFITVFISGFFIWQAYKFLDYFNVEMDYLKLIIGAYLLILNIIISIRYMNGYSFYGTWHICVLITRILLVLIAIGLSCRAYFYSKEQLEVLNKIDMYERLISYDYENFKYRRQFMGICTMTLFDVKLLALYDEKHDTLLEKYNRLRLLKG